MDASTYYWRLSNWIWTGCLIGLAGCTIAVAAFLYLPRTPLVIPGDADYDRGSKLLDEAAPLANGDLRKEKLEQAIDAFGKAIEKNPGNYLAYFKRANANQLLGKTDAAITDYGKALSLNPEHADSYCGRAVANMEKARFKLAVDDLNKATNLVPDSYRAFSLRARAKLLAGRYAEADEDARSAISLNAEGGDTLRTPGPSRPPSAIRQPDSTVEYLMEAIRPDKTLTAQGKADLAQAYYNLGISLTGRGKEAENALAESRRLDFNYDNLCGEYQDGRNLYATYQERTDGAKRGRIERATAYWPSEATLPQLEFQAFDALKQGMFDIALAQFTHILDVDAKRTDVRIWCGRGAAYLGKNDPDAAIGDFERAIYLVEGFAAAYCLRGQAYAMKGYYDQTILDTTQAIRLQPDYAWAHFHRAVAYYMKNKREHALADLDEAVALDPKSEVQTRSAFADICDKHGTAHMDERRWDDAIASFDIALSANKNTASKFKPHLAQAYAEQGFAHLAAEHWGKAIACFDSAISLEKNRAIQLNPHLVRAYGERGFDRANRREFEEAVADLNKALALDKHSAQTYRRCGLTCCKMAKDCRDRGHADEKAAWEDARQYLKRAIWLDPELAVELRRPLEEAERHSGSVSARASVMLPKWR